jgi:hypothetical protein
MWIGPRVEDLTLRDRVARSYAGPVLVATTWWQWLGGVAIFLAISVTGITFLRRVAESRPRERIDPEDVAQLDVFFVCAECGTELQVTRLGEIQVPRHCGEPMTVVRRPHPAEERGSP